jgi:hypothetical protein
MDSEQGRKERDSDRKERDLQMRLVESKVRIEESMVRINETKVRIRDVKYDEFNKLCRDLNGSNQQYIIIKRRHRRSQE